jgi:integrase
MKNIIEKRELNNNGRLTFEKLESQLDHLVKGQEVNQQELRLGFIGLAKQNQELLDLNNQLSEQLKKVVEELDILKKEREEKEIRKQARAKRKRLPKRDPITLEIYEQLITSITGSDYKSARLRLAILILTICGIRVSELLPLKVGQLLTLVKSNWISINRSKRGPSSHKAYLTGLGKKLMDKRRQDFEIIFTMKELDSYVFTSEKTHYKPLRRDTLTKEINLVLRNLSKILPDKPNLTTHSFRIGFISQLWRDTNDIEFVRQAIGHEKVESTSSYIENLSDEERRLRMEQITAPEELIIKKNKKY